MLLKYVFSAFLWILPFRIITSPGGHSEKQVSVARCQPLELFHSMFIQVFLSLKPLFWHKQNTLAWSCEPNHIGAYHNCT